MEHIIHFLVFALALVFAAAAFHVSLLAGFVCLTLCFRMLLFPARNHYRFY